MREREVETLRALWDTITIHFIFDRINSCILSGKGMFHMTIVGGNMGREKNADIAFSLTAPPFLSFSIRPNRSGRFWLDNAVMYGATAENLYCCDCIVIGIGFHGNPLLRPIAQ